MISVDRCTQTLGAISVDRCTQTSRGDFGRQAGKECTLNGVTTEVRKSLEDGCRKAMLGSSVCV